MSDLTPEQQTAVAKRGTSVVLVGAGCGKTTVLSERYLDYLRRGEARVGEIVAITFTERAAREMRKRIRAAIVQERERGKLTSNPWDEHQRDLETASIGTIHSFCSGLLHHYALSAGLDPSFQVLEETLAPSLIDAALDDSLQALLIADDRKGEDLRSLIEVYGWYTVRSGVVNLLSSADAAGWTDWSDRPPSEIAALWQEFARTMLLPASIRHALANVPAITLCVELLRTTPFPGPKMAANARAVLDGIDGLATTADVPAAIEGILKAARVQGTESAKAWADAETYRCVQAALAKFRDALPGMFALPEIEPVAIEESAKVAQRFLRVSAVCREEYRQRKRQNALVDFNDLIVLTRDLLRDHRGVREVLRRRYRYILLDELQDTDPVQMQLVELLCGPGLTAGKLFAVGDSKQSIYRFRGAEEGVFRKLRDQIPDAGRLCSTLNFRSQPAIIDFVNALFQKHIRGYEPLRASRPQLTADPCVEFLWSEPAPGDADAGRERHAGAIAARIAQLIRAAEPLVVEKDGRPRSVRARDVVLLFRSMSHVAAYEMALQNAKLDYYLVGGRAFFAQQEVYDLLNLLRALENPLDGLSLAGALRSPFGGVSDEALYWLAQHEDGIWAGLHDPAAHDRLSDRDKPHVERALRFFASWRARKDRLPIASLINSVLDDCGYDAALQFENLGDRKLANLWKLIDLARIFDRSGLFGIDDFIRHLGSSVMARSREEQAATLPEEADVVRLMTIHQAKGLEFPVVVLPDIAARTGGMHFPCVEWHDALGCVVRPPAEDEPPLFSRFAWDVRQKSEDLADWDEDLRTFYVACTRAEDYLVLAGVVDVAKPETNTVMTVLADRFNLEAAGVVRRVAGG